MNKFCNIKKGIPTINYLNCYQFLQGYDYPIFFTTDIVFSEDVSCQLDFMVLEVG